jgi:hypothetical protein
MCFDDVFVYQESAMKPWCLALINCPVAYRILGMFLHISIGGVKDN